jgi:hypothetical protein
MLVDGMCDSAARTDALLSVVGMQSPLVHKFRVKFAVFLHSIVKSLDVCVLTSTYACGVCVCLCVCVCAGAGTGQEHAARRNGSQNARDEGKRIHSKSHGQLELTGAGTARHLLILHR